MLKVFDQYNNPVGYIDNYTELCIESELESGDKTMSFTYRDMKSTLIQNEYYIETEDDRYVVKEIDVSSDGYPEICCQLDLEDLEREVISGITAEEATLEGAAQFAIAGTGWRVDTDIDKVRYVAAINVTPLDLLYKIRDGWMCEIRFDTKNRIVYFREEFGEDRGVYFNKALNLKKVQLKNDSYDYYTRILPIGADDLRIGDVNDGVDYLENYQYSDKVKVYLWEDTNYTDAEALKEDAEKKLDDMSKPAKSYDADVIDLAKQSADYDILDYGLGDTIILFDEETGIKDRQRIVKITEYPRDPSKNSCELSNTFLTFEEMQSKLEAAANAFEEITNEDGTVNGYYVHGVTSDGVVVIETVIGEDGSTTTTSTTLTNAMNSYGDEITAISGRLGSLELNSLTVEEANILYASIEDLEAAYAYIWDLEARYAEIESLVVGEMAADIAQIKYLLAGNAEVEDLLTIYLTGENAVIEYAVIEQALMGSVLASVLTAGIIYTDNIQIANNEGQQMWIDGATIQMTDYAGTPRVQIGEDNSGDYNLYLWNADGDLIWDAQGLTEEGLIGNGQIIKNNAVADDAAIAGHKLDIESVSTELNDAGHIVVNGAQVIIDDNTLDYHLSSIEETITGLEGVTFEGLMRFTAYWALWDDFEEAPPVGLTHEVVPAYTDVAETDVSFTDMYDAITDYWTTEQPSYYDHENESTRYLWLSYLCEYQDGHTEWTTPYLITDAYLRSTTTSIQTEFSIVEGEISSMVRQTDFDAVITDVYTSITQTADNITAQVNEIIEGEVGVIKASLVLEIDDQNRGVLSGNANLIYLEAGQIVITSGGGKGSFELTEDGNVIINAANFQLDENGNLTATNAYLEGEIFANGGTIGGFNIGSDSIYTISDSFATTASNVYIGSSGISLGTNFSVTPIGRLTARSGEIGMFTLNTDAMYSDYNRFAYYDDNIYFGEDGISFGTTFSVSKKGVLTALTGYISIWEIKDDYLYSEYAYTDEKLGDVDYYTILRPDGFYQNSQGNKTEGTGTAVVIRNGYLMALEPYDAVRDFLKKDWNYESQAVFKTLDYGIYAEQFYNTLSVTISQYLVGGAAAVASDRSLKSDIQPLNKNYDSLIDCLTPRAYTVDAQPEQKHIGFVVDEVEDAMKSAGMDPDDYGLTDSFTDNDGRELGAIRYEEIIPILVYEIQQLKSQLKGES